MGLYKFVIITNLISIGSLGIFGAANNSSEPILLDKISRVVDRKSSRQVALPTTDNQPVTEFPSVLGAPIEMSKVTAPTLIKESDTRVVSPIKVTPVLDGTSARNSAALDIMADHLATADTSKVPTTVTKPTDTVINIGQATHLDNQTYQTVYKLLEQDHEDNVKDLIKYRWCFRKCANITDLLGNTLLYLGSGIATIAGGVSTVGGPQAVTQYLLFASTICFASHVTLIGWAKCSAREEGEREDQLQDLANAVNFKVTPLNPVVIDGDSTDVPINSNTVKVDGSGVSNPPNNTATVNV